MQLSALGLRFQLFFALRYAPCTMRLALLIFGRFLSPVKEGAMFTPPAQLNVFDFLFNRGGMPLTIPLGFTPWNSFSACLLAKSDRIGGDRIDLLNRGNVIPLGVQLFLKKISHKAPPTHIEGGAFLFCPVDFCYSSGAHTISPGASYGERSKRV